MEAVIEKCNTSNITSRETLLRIALIKGVNKEDWIEKNLIIKFAKFAYYDILKAVKIDR